MMKTACVLLLSALCATAYIFPRPDPFNKPMFARWLVHEANWTSLSTTSVQHNGVAYTNFMASSDGENWTDCSGHIYIYYNKANTENVDIEANNRVTLGYSEVGENDVVCQDSQHFDVEDPNCGRATIVGRVRVVSNVSASAIPQKYLFWRHPAMATWPKEHHWITATIDIETVDLLSMYGPLSHITAEEYYGTSCHN